MKKFEIVYNTLRPLLPALNIYVYRKIKFLVKSLAKNIELLDVGGRKSHQSINKINARHLSAVAIEE